MMRLNWISSIAVPIILLVLSAVTVSPQSDQFFLYDKGPVPDEFHLGQRYPDRNETEECRPIRLRIERDSRRFRTDLVHNAYTGIDFAHADARLMTSRMQVRLNALAILYYQEYGLSFTVIKSWTEYGDADLVADDHSLHYEGT